MYIYILRFIQRSYSIYSRMAEESAGLVSDFGILSNGPQGSYRFAKTVPDSVQKSTESPTFSR